MSWRLACSIVSMFFVMIVVCLALDGHSVADSPMVQSGQASTDSALFEHSDASRWAHRRLLDLLLEAQSIEADYGPDHPKLQKIPAQIEAVKELLSDNTLLMDRRPSSPSVARKQIEDMGAKELRGFVCFLSEEIASLRACVSLLEEEENRFRVSPAQNRCAAGHD